jgi:sterol desaturase/sphingolipid hydroxylase (fatty acid hydroxylase superfamily)
VGFIFLTRTASYLAVLVGLLTWEWRSPFVMATQRKLPRVAFHVGLSAANSILLYAVMTWPLVAAMSASRDYGIGLAPRLGLAGIGEILTTVLVFDLWNYWMHRLNHRLPLLWRFHTAHHSDMEIDVTTASRFHPGELLISNGVKCLMILVWGPSLAGLVTFDILLTACSQFHHGNLGIPLGAQDVLERVIVTPRMHRCHHSLHRECAISNYSTICSAWDRLFGSYHREEDREKLLRIGLPQPRGAETMQLRPFLMTPFRAK